MPNFKLLYQNKFIKKLGKLIKNNALFEKQVLKTLDLLKVDPLNSKLKSHKVLTKEGNVAFSSTVTSDIRIIWNYHNGRTNVLDVLDIGGHEGKNKVYK